MNKPKKINCKWCGMGHEPRENGEHWVVKSIIPARINISECAYHKAGEISPLQKAKGLRAIAGFGFSESCPGGTVNDDADQ